jgi:hypothetical protein
LQKSAVVLKVLTGEVGIEGADGIHLVFFNFFFGRNFACNNGILKELFKMKLQSLQHIFSYFVKIFISGNQA